MDVETEVDRSSDDGPKGFRRLPAREVETSLLYTRVTDNDGCLRSPEESGGDSVDGGSGRSRQEGGGG